MTKFGVKLDDITADGPDPDLAAENDEPMEDVRAHRPYMEALAPPNPSELDGVKSGQTSASDGKYSPFPMKEQIIIEKDGSTQFVTDDIWKHVSRFREMQGGDSDMEGDDDGNPASNEYRLGLAGKSDPALGMDTSHFLFGSMEKNLNPDLQHPPPHVAMRFWKIFRKNVDPLVKVFHCPTVEKLLQEHVPQASQGKMPRNVAALAFSIYLFSIMSMTPEEVFTLTGETREGLIRKYRDATQMALVQASVLRSLDITTLQALTLFLLAMRSFFDARAMWILAGMTIRIAQRMGLHKDGQGSQLSPFQVEMRRRLWWQIIVLDRTTAEISGAGKFASACALKQTLTSS